MSAPDHQVSSAAQCGFVHSRTGARCPFHAVLDGYCRRHRDGTNRTHSRQTLKPQAVPAPAVPVDALCARCPRLAVADGLCRVHRPERERPRIRHQLAPVPAVTPADAAALPVCAGHNGRTGAPCPRPAWTFSPRGLCRKHENTALARERRAARLGRTQQWRTLELGEVCVEDGCTDPATHAPLCRRHHDLQVKREGARRRVGRPRRPG